MKSNPDARKYVSTSKRKELVNMNTFDREHTQWIVKAENLIGYQFQDKKLLETSLSCGSLNNNAESYDERLAVIGDQVLGMVAMTFLFNEFPGSSKGDLSKMKANVVSNESCLQYSQFLGLEKVFKYKGGDLSPHRMGGVFEAVIGAIRQDAGYDAVERYLLQKFAPLFLKNTNEEQIHAKNKIQEWDSDIKYRTSHRGPPHQPIFKSAVLWEGALIYGEEKRTKKAAELSAAYELYNLVKCGVRDEGVIPKASSEQTRSIKLQQKPARISDEVLTENMQNLSLRSYQQFENEYNPSHGNTENVSKAFPVKSSKSSQHSNNLSLRIPNTTHSSKNPQRISKNQGNSHAPLKEQVLQILKSEKGPIPQICIRRKLANDISKKEMNSLLYKLLEQGLLKMQRDGTKPMWFVSEKTRCL